VSVRTVTAEQAAAALGSFDAIIDARSPAEYAEDHLPGAVNWPVLDDDERRVVGTEYKQISAFDARKRGAAMVARRIAEHLEAHAQDKPQNWHPLVYCWRGGQRSGTLAWFLGQVGFRVNVLQGGYKAFRAEVLAHLASLPQQLHFVVVCGRTGSGKTRLLQALRDAGGQVLDLEALACHRGSVLGGLPAQAQPTQKGFDMALWRQLATLDPARPVFVESESRRIGQLHLPEALIERMRSDGRCVMVNMPDAARVELLLEEYGFYAADVERFCGHLDALVELRGKATVAAWQAQARAGQWPELFADLMRHHYDPLYLRSTERNFAGQAQALQVDLPDGHPHTLAGAAATLVAQLG
jgi:tRNA 2-selenouridine synthase